MEEWFTGTQSYIALLAMLSFATNIMITRYAVARMPVEAGFLLVLADFHLRFGSRDGHAT